MKGKKTGGGSRKGKPNKATADVRAAIVVLAQGNIGKFQGWLDRTARKQPAKAAELFLRVLEYHIPKVSKLELSGPGGMPMAAMKIDTKDPAEAMRQYSLLINGRTDSP